MESIAALVTLCSSKMLCTLILELGDKVVHSLDLFDSIRVKEISGNLPGTLNKFGFL